MRQRHESAGERLASCIPALRRRSWRALIDADAEPVTEMLANATRVSEALSRAGIRHRFEICEDKLAAYLDWDWPSNEPNAGSR